MVLPRRRKRRHNSLVLKAPFRSLSWLLRRPAVLAVTIGVATAAFFFLDVLFFGRDDDDLR